MRLISWGTVGLLLLCSCASSERMMRITGDVSSYTPPKADRLKGMKNLPRLPQKLRSRQLGGEINLWPFFFRHRDYWNALWPVIDCDAYGFAVRPFYVQEGREKSILFPLSAWNNESGWVLNTYWKKDSYGSVPFFHRGEKFSYWGPVWANKKAWGIFPLVYWGKNGKYVFPTITFARGQWDATYIFPCFLFSRDSINFTGPVWWSGGKSESVWGVFPVWCWNTPREHFLLPLYFKDKNAFYSIPYSYKESRNGTLRSVLGPLYWHSFSPQQEYTLAGGLFYTLKEKKFKLYDLLTLVNEKNFSDNRFIVDLFCREYGLKSVKDYAAFAALKKELAQKVSKEYYGLFPLFHRSVSQGETEFDILKILYRQKTVNNTLTSPRWMRKRSFSVSLPLFLTFYKKQLHKEEFISLLLMYGTYKCYETSVTDELMPAVYGHRKSFFAGTYFRLWCNENLKKYGIVLPKEVKTPEQVAFYLDFLKYSDQFPRKMEHSGSGFFPLWHYDHGKKGYSFLLNCLLSGWGRDKDGFFRYSLPLLSWEYQSNNGKKGGSGILFPLYQSSYRQDDTIEVAEKEDLHRGKFKDAFEYSKQNWGVFFAVREKGKFYVPRQKNYGGKLRNVLRSLNDLERKKAVFQRDAKLQSERKRLFRQAALECNMPLPDLEDLKALAASKEPLLKELGQLGRSQLRAKAAIDKVQKKLTSDLAALGVTYRGNAGKAKKELLEKHIAVSEVSKVRSLFFSSDKGEVFHKWSLLCLLLRSAKTPEKSHFSVLEFLYRYRREGKRTSVLCFPFVTVNTDEKSSEWSFLYRFLHFRNEKSRVSGHICFIPFGSK